MNTLVREEFGLLHEMQAMRAQIVDTLSDADLAYKLPGDNVPLLDLCRDIGLIERSYIESFKTFTHNFVYDLADASHVNTVSELRAWYAELDADLDAALRGLSDNDIANQQIDRGFGFMLTPRMQFHVYREALLIFYARATLYLRALQKPIPQHVQEWIG